MRGGAAVAGTVIATVIATVTATVTTNGTGTIAVSCRPLPC